MSNYSDLSNKQLDAAYAAYFDAGDKGSAVPFASEIAARLSTVSGFFHGLIGSSQFPLYDDRLGKAYGIASQSDSAKKAVSDSAAKVGSTLKWGGGAIIFGVIALAIFVVFLKFKK